MSLKTLFVLGKGGTGKSTIAALMALELAGRNKKTLLVSLDDAHNQSDIFQTRFTHKPVRVSPYLRVIQLDRDREIHRYLKGSAAQVKHSFSYLTAFNLDHYFDVLKLSPGMEEYALVTAYEALIGEYKDYDYLIADMPPTALSMRFFNLPALSLTWIEQLEKLRMEIRKKKEVISTIRMGKKELEQDKILSRIHQIKSQYKKTLTAFQDPARTRIITVSNPDALSGSETVRINDQLAALDMPVTGRILNQRAPGHQGPGPG
ncbi:MAG: TRC40/GET3/ArsA family transport-energizing ATPase, partial [Desulfobacterales bacterium]|nr:TRC40/GET3/ArsA family transport-energizing ATPase [Desulfobacterales bacterium]